MCPYAWREWCDGIVGLRALIIGDINKVTEKKEFSWQVSWEQCILDPSFGEIVISLAY